MARDTLLGFPSHTLPYRYRQSYHFIDSLTAGKPQWFPGSFYIFKGLRIKGFGVIYFFIVLQDSELNLQNIHPNYL